MQRSKQYDWSQSYVGSGQKKSGFEIPVTVLDQLGHRPQSYVDCGSRRVYLYGHPGLHFKQQIAHYPWPWVYN